MRTFLRHNSGLGHLPEWQMLMQRWPHGNCKADRIIDGIETLKGSLYIHSSSNDCHSCASSRAAPQSLGHCPRFGRTRCTCRAPGWVHSGICSWSPQHKEHREADDNLWDRRAHSLADVPRRILVRNWHIPAVAACHPTEAQHDRPACSYDCHTLVCVHKDAHRMWVWSSSRANWLPRGHQCRWHSRALRIADVVVRGIHTAREEGFTVYKIFLGNYCIFTLLAPGRIAAPAGLTTRTAAWQRALQMWEQLLVSLGRPHGCAQGGHSPLWQRCLMAWWHLAVMLWAGKKGINLSKLMKK